MTVSINGNTGGTPDTWVEIIPVERYRTTWYFENPKTNSDDIIIGFGDSGSEAQISILEPGQSMGESAPDTILKDRLVAQSSGTSVAFTGYTSK